MEQAASILDRLRLPRRGTGFHGLMRKLDYLPTERVDPIVRAFEFSASAHEGQKRMSGDPYVSHPVAVAGILADLRLDSESISSALLHDVLEDTATDRQDLESQFGGAVATIVDGVSKLDQLNFTSRAEAQVESFRKMMLAMVGDIRVILVKLADRLHNMQTLESMPGEKQRRIATETLEIYAPIANRLGINSIKTELEDLGFRYAYPYRYRVIDKALRRAQGNQRQPLKKISDRITRSLKGAGIEATVNGRQKHLYSIYRKMLTKKRSLSEIADVFGVRIIVSDADTCYRVLGIVHQMYKPMPGRFKDYIAIPRLNGYQSLHTAVLGPNGIPMEVQIRTEQMEQLAESGIAAHWIYKSGDPTALPPEIRAREWLSSIDEIQTDSDSEEFMENVKINLFPDNVYVFTPKGEILRLPAGATPVDFAYAVHTELGNRCVAAKVDRRLVPLRTPLRNGQTIEIITARGATPNPNWVNFVASAKARSGIRQFLKNLKRVEAKDLGKRLLENSLKDSGTSLRKAGRGRMDAVLDELSLNNTNELFEQIGLGERLAPVVARLLMQSTEQEAEAGKRTPVLIAGTEGMVVSYARCCHPIPGDPIMGYLSKGRGVVIHRNICGNLADYRKQPRKWINVAWEKNIDREFTVEVRAEVTNRPGALAEAAARISEAGSNIEQVAVQGQHDQTAELLFLMQVKNRVHLAQVIRRLRAIPDVKRVSRLCA